MDKKKLVCLPIFRPLMFENKLDVKTLMFEKKPFVISDDS